MAVKELEIKPFSKKGYKSFKFEDIAFNISERVEPKQTYLDIYVGLEHIDPNSIHIKRHGTPSDVEGTKLKVYPGDLIFGKRRAYQRKAAVANFEGICSAHAMVLRANPKVIIPDLFPFFIHSDQFMNRAIDISVGSLSPTINWGTLKTQEFVLPPLDQQAKLAELLWAGDLLIEKENTLFNSALQFKQSTMKDLLNGQSLAKEDLKKWRKLKISDLGVINTSSVDKKIDTSEKMVNLLNYMDVYSSFDKMITSKLDFMQVTANPNQLIKNQLNIGDVVFTPSSETPSDIGHSAVIMEELPNTLHSYHLVRLSFKEKIDLNFKRFLFNNPNVLKNFEKKAKGVTRYTLSLEDFNTTEVYIPPVDIQKSIASTLSKIDETILKLKEKINSTVAIQKQLINQIFG